MTSIVAKETNKKGLQNILLVYQWNIH